MNNFLMKVGGVLLDGKATAVQTTSFNTDACKILFNKGYSITAAWTGTTTGTVKLQASNDPSESLLPGSFVDIPGTVADLAAGSPITWNVDGAHYTWVRLSHTDTGGGDLTPTIRMTIKE